jgi:hypothetical protein
MTLEIVLGTANIHYVISKGIRVGEISRDGSTWRFHYTATWFNPAREEEIAFWKLVNDKKTILNLTERLKS